MDVNIVNNFYNVMVRIMRMMLYRKKELVCVRGSWCVPGLARTVLVGEISYRRTIETFLSFSTAMAIIAS
jgi:hypothetical protein